MMSEICHLTSEAGLSEVAWLGWPASLLSAFDASLSPGMREFKFLLDGALMAFDRVERPLIIALIGWGIGSVARAIVKRPAAPV
jgi:hypothetical protein